MSRRRKGKGKTTFRSELLTPLDLSIAVKEGTRTFRKQILPFTTINYRGQKITFDRPYLEALKKAFDKKAYDQVPLVLADASNRHHEDPERFRGKITGVELSDTGLDAIISTTKRGAKIVKDNPDLGVSARIVPNLEKADGRKFPVAIRHVLATMNPVVTGMSPWQAVDLSTESTDVVDLTAQQYQEGSTVATKKKSKAASHSAVVTVETAKGKRTLDLSELTDDEFNALLDLSEPVKTEPKAKETKKVVKDKGGKKVDLAATDTKDKKKDKGKVPLFVKKSGPTGKEGQETVVKGKPKGAAKKKGDRLQALSLSVAQKDWQRERRDLVRAGVPPHILDLAEPILSSPEDFTIDLSDDDSVDASDVVRKMVDATKGFIQIRPEIGHTVDLSDTDDTSPADALLKAWGKEFPNH